MYSSLPLFLLVCLFQFISSQKLKTEMVLNSATIFSAPPIYNHRHHHKKKKKKKFPLQPPPNAPTLQFLKNNVGTRNNKHFQSSLAMCKSSNKYFRVCCAQVKVEESLSDEACELVNGTELTIGDDDNGIQAYLFTAVKNNNEAGILLLSDIFGFEDSSTTDLAYRLACNGYNVLVPDLFNGDSWTKEKPKALFEQWISKHKPEQIAKTIFASAKWMINEFAALGIKSKLGIIGFCYGGGRVVDILAQDREAYFGSGVSFYGTRIDSSIASNIKVPLLLITGDNDELCPVSVLEEITMRNKEVKMVVFRGMGHGFAHRPQTPEEDSDAEEAFVKMKSWLHDGLLVKS